MKTVKAPRSLYDKQTELYERAACKGANPLLFEATKITAKNNAAHKALAFCRVCPVKQLCVDVVLAPYEGDKALFTGVAGGRIWIRGNDVTTSKEQAIIDWRLIERIIRGEVRGARLLPHENAVAIVAGTAAGMTSVAIGQRLGLNAAYVRKRRSNLHVAYMDTVTEKDFDHAESLGHAIRSEVSDAA